MRVSTLSNILFLTDEADKKFRQMATLLREITTGRRANLYSTEPEKVFDLISVKWNINKVEQYEDNIKFAKGLLLTADDILGKAYDVLLEVKAKLVEAANSASDYTNLKQSLTALRDRLLQYANTRVGDYYLFAGDNYTAKPFDTADYTYRGGSNPFSVKVAENDYVGVFTVGSEAFGSGSGSIFAVIDSAINNIADRQAVENAIGEVEIYLKKIDALRGKIGDAEKKLEDYSLTYSELLDNLKKRRSDIEDTDMDAAISQYQTANTAYQAVLSLLAKEGGQSSVLLKYF